MKLVTSTEEYDESAVRDLQDLLMITTRLREMMLDLRMLGFDVSQLVAVPGLSGSWNNEHLVHTDLHVTAGWGIPNPPSRVHNVGMSVWVDGEKGGREDSILLRLCCMGGSKNQGRRTLFREGGGNGVFTFRLTDPEVYPVLSWGVALLFDTRDKPTPIEEVVEFIRKKVEENVNVLPSTFLVEWGLLP